MGAQQDALATQLNAQGAWSPQQMAQANASAPPPKTPQQHLAILLQPQSSSEVLLSQSPYQKGINWVFHNQATGQLSGASLWLRSNLFKSYRVYLVFDFRVYHCHLV